MMEYNVQHQKMGTFDSPQMDIALRGQQRCCWRGELGNSSRRRQQQRVFIFGMRDEDGYRSLFTPFYRLFADNEWGFMVVGLFLHWNFNSVHQNSMRCKANRSRGLETAGGKNWRVIKERVSFIANAAAEETKEKRSFYRETFYYCVPSTFQMSPHPVHHRQFTSTTITIISGGDNELRPHAPDATNRPHRTVCCRPSTAVAGLFLVSCSDKWDTITITTRSRRIEAASRSAVCGILCELYLHVPSTIYGIFQYVDCS